MSKKKTPIWAWIGCGCLLCVFLFIAVIGGIGVAGFTFVKGVVEDMADPEARTAAAMNLLGAEALPDGYFTRGFLNIPFVMQLAILSDGEPLPAVEGENLEEKAQQLENLVLRSDQLGRNTVIYLKLRDRNPDETIEDILSGDGRSNANVDLGVEFENGELASEGEMDVQGQPVSWRAYEGEMDTMGGAHDGIFAALNVICSNGEIHDFLWFQKTELEEENIPEDGSLPDLDSASSRLSGTPGDPDAIRDLFGHFQLCAD